MVNARRVIGWRTINPEDERARVIRRPLASRTAQQALRTVYESFAHGFDAVNVSRRLMRHSGVSTFHKATADTDELVDKYKPLDPITRHSLDKLVSMLEDKLSGRRN